MPGVTQQVTDHVGSRILNPIFITDPQAVSGSPPLLDAQPTSPRAREVSYFLWTSVRVMPCSVTLKWTTVGVGRTSLSKVVEMAFRTARAPLRVSTLTEVRYRAWQPVDVNVVLGPCQDPPWRGRWGHPGSGLPSAQSQGSGFFLLWESSGAPLSHQQAGRRD